MTKSQTIANLLRQLADEIEGIDLMAPANGAAPEVEAVPEHKAEPDVKPVEEAFIETASEAGEKVEPAPRTVEETRAIVSKACKAGLKAQTKEILNKYGSSVSEVGEKTPEKLALLYEDVADLLEKNNA